MSTRGKLTEAHAALGAQRVTDGAVLPGYEDVHRRLRRRHRSHGVQHLSTSQVTCDIAGDGQGYTLHAAGNSGTDVDGFEFTVNEANQRATASVATGWTANANCWIRNKGGEC